MPKPRQRVDFDAEQYYTFPFAGGDSGAVAREEVTESRFAVKTEIARLALNIEELVNEHSRLVSEIAEAARKRDEDAAGSDSRLKDMSDRLDSLRALLVTRLSGIIPALQDSLSNHNDEIRAELTALGRLVAESGSGKARGLAESPVHIEEQLDRIESSLAIKDRMDSEMKTGRELLDLVSVVDSFDRLLSYLVTAGLSGNESWAVGVRSIHSLLLDYLGKKGLRRIEEFESFDPEIHRAMGTVDNDSLPDGSVAKVLLSGYLWKGKVLRCAEVVVVKRGK